METKTHVLVTSEQEPAKHIPIPDTPEVDIIERGGYMGWVHGVGTWGGYMRWVHGVDTWGGYMRWVHGVGT